MWETLRATLYHNRRDVIMLMILTAFSIIIFLPMMTRWQVMGDYTTHNQLALWAVNEPLEFFRNTPHFLYHISVALIYRLIPKADINVAAAWTMTLCFIAMNIVIYWQLRSQTDLPPTISIIIVSGLLTMGLSVIMPINFFTPENLYFGYMAPHVYHNPTMIIMKPFAILLFFMSLRLFFNSKPLSRWWILAFALVTALSIVAKPSFIIAFVPTLGLVTFFLMVRVSRWWLLPLVLAILLSIILEPIFVIISVPILSLAIYILIRRDNISELLSIPEQIFQAFFFKDIESAKELPMILRPTYINWVVLIVGMVLPTFAVLAYQTMTWTSSGGIGIDPFRVLLEWTLHYEENADKQILYKFIMSCAFPMAIYLFHIRKAYKDIMLNIAWLFFFVSAAYLYLLVDYTVIAAGDFGWSSQIAALILYITSTIFMLRQYGAVLTGEGLSTQQWTILLMCLGIFILHLVAGIHWYRMHMSQYMEELLYRWW